MLTDNNFIKVYEINNKNLGEVSFYMKSEITLGEAKRILGFKEEDMEWTINASQSGPLEVRSKSGSCLIKFHENVNKEDDTVIVDVQVFLRAGKKNAWLGKD